MTNFSMSSNFVVNKDMGSFSDDKMGFPNHFDAVAASDVTTAAPEHAAATTKAAVAAASSTAAAADPSISTTTLATTTVADAWDAAMTTEPGSTTPAPPASDFQAMINNLLADAENYVKGCRELCTSYIPNGRFLACGDSTITFTL